MAKKRNEVASWPELLGPGGLEGFWNPDDPKLKRKRERAQKLVLREFGKILQGLHADEEAKQQEKLKRKLAESGESP